MKPRRRLIRKKTGNRKLDFVIGTWNVRTLYKPGAVTNLVKEVEKYKIKCIALQEVKSDDSTTNKISKTTIFSGKCKQNHQLGTDFAVHESIIHAVREFKDINPRISTITLRTDNMDIVLINVHEPTDEKDEEEKELFYAILENVYKSVKGNIILVLGEFNAKIGRERYYRAIIGNHILREISNDNGTKLVNFAAEKDLVVKSTMIPRKDIHKYTWIAPNGLYKNQIYRILINNRFKNSIKNIRTLRGADSESDHLLVEFWMKVKFNLKKRQTANQ